MIRQLWICDIPRLGKVYCSINNSSCIKIGLAYTGSCMHLWVLIFCALGLQRTWSCLAKMKGKKRSLHVLALTIEKFFASFLTDFLWEWRLSYSEWANCPYSDDLLLHWAFGLGICVKEGSCCLWELCLNFIFPESSKLTPNLWSLNMPFASAPHPQKAAHVCT